MRGFEGTAVRRRSMLLKMAGAIGAAGTLGGGLAACASPPATVPAPQLDVATTPSSTSETLVLAGGCFWGVQGLFQHVRGVTLAVSGYAGGDAATARYDTVSTGNTDHAEAVRITFDPGIISYGQLLQVFFGVAHDPTQLDYSGPDHGRQYRSALFPMNDEQARVARAYIAQLDASHAFTRKLVTTVEPGKTFYVAEAHHQDYMARHPAQPYILIHDRPKLEALKARYPQLFRPQPVLVSRTG